MASSCAAPPAIRVNSIHPAGVDTPLNDGLAEMEGMTTQEIAERSAGKLLPRPVDRAARRRRRGAVPGG
jgi:NAD(P)-dependent dehydrogenase (short-subunit alcohol dehydrogenase family)